MGEFRSVIEDIFHANTSYYFRGGEWFPNSTGHVCGHFLAAQPSCIWGRCGGMQSDENGHARFEIEQCGNKSVMFGG
jgi:hypothetical protein